MSEAEEYLNKHYTKACLVYRENGIEKTGDIQYYMIHKLEAKKAVSLARKEGFEKGQYKQIEDMMFTEGSMQDALRKVREETAKEIMDWYNQRDRARSSGFIKERGYTIKDFKKKFLVRK